MISKNTAQQIVDTVKDVCGYDINYISNDGIIIASTDEKRIGDYHEIGRRAAVTGQVLEVYDNDSFEGAQKGVNIPFSYHGQTLGVIGITGEPDEVRSYARLALRIMRLLLRERDLDASRELKRAEFSYVAKAMIRNETINHEYLRDFLKQKQQDGKSLCAEEVYKSTYIWLKKIGCASKVSPQLLALRFRQFGGTTPQNLILQTRLEQAKKLMRNPKIKLDAIAEQCGFSSKNRLFHVFKERFGITIGDFRAQE